MFLHFPVGVGTTRLRVGPPAGQEQETGDTGEGAVEEPSRNPGKGRQRKKVRGKELRQRIIAACSQREVTPREIAEQEKVSLSTANHHFRALKEAGYLEITREERARGAKRYFYVALRQRLITSGEFEQLKVPERSELSRALLLDFLHACNGALRTGTLDARGDSHLSWSPFDLDHQGWKELTSATDRMLDLSLEIQAGSQARLKKSGEEPIPTVFGLFAFEGPASAPTKTAFTGRRDETP